MILHFSGASDDLIELDGDMSEEWSYPTGGFTAELIGPGQTGARVHVTYTTEGDGLWMVGLSQLNEDNPIPDAEYGWGFGITQQPDCGYSTRLTIVCPSDTRVLVDGDEIGGDDD